MYFPKVLPFLIIDNSFYLEEECLGCLLNPALFLYRNYLPLLISIVLNIRNNHLLECRVQLMEPHIHIQQSEHLILSLPDVLLLVYECGLILSKELLGYRRLFKYLNTRSSQQMLLIQESYLRWAILLTLLTLQSSEVVLLL